MIGSTISHYKVLEKLGEGGMGIVYKARDLERDRIIALKILNREAALDADVRRRFLREAGAGAGLVHPNIAQMYEAGDFEGQHFICLEYVDGKNLRDMLQSGPLPPREVVSIGIAAGSALHLAHTNGIVHRDIKAENIMITADGTVKVMDFGLAKVQNASLLTREGDIVGTIAYMSPEQATGEPVDHRTDIFSFGVLLYELLTGKLPFWAAYETAIVYAILNTEPMSIHEQRKEVPEALEQIVFKALRKDRQSRYQRMDDLVGDLARVKAFFDGERDVLPGVMELVAGAGAPGEEIWGSQIKLAARQGFQANLAGREKEFGLLKDRLQRAAAGTGQVALIGGEAGIGKTRLVDELESYARTLRIRSLTLNCGKEDISSPYRPLVDALIRFLDSRGVTSADSFTQFVAGVAPDLSARAPILTMFLGLGATDESTLVNREQLWDAVGTLIVRISAERPLMLFVDDVHWADDETLALIGHLMRTTAGARVMIVGTYRTDEVNASGIEGLHPLMQLVREMEGNERFTALTLARLEAAAIREMVASLFPDADFGRTFYESLHEETEGNPFFVVETLKLLKAEGIIEKADGVFRLRSDFGRVAIPRSIQDIVMRRIERLKEDEREILEIGAVEGESFHSGTIQSCLELGRIRLLRKLQSLERDHHIIHPEEKTFRFDHGKIREFLYDAITPELKVEYHLMIGNYLAETFPGEEQLAPNIAHHFLGGGNERRALPYLVSGGELSRRLFANKQAIDYYQKAWRIILNVEKSESEAAIRKEKEIVMEGMADVWSLTGSHQESLGKYRALLELRGIAPLKRTELLQKIGTVHANIGENDQALRALQDAEKELGEREPGGVREEERKRALAKTRITRSRVFKSLGRYDDATAEVEGGLSLIDQAGSLRNLADAYNNLGVIYEDRGSFDLAAEMFSKSLTSCEKLGDRKGVASGYNNLANVYASLGDYRRTAENLKRGLDIMTEIGYRAGIAGACNNLGSVYQDQGRYEEALAMHERCLALREEIGDMPGMAMSHGNIGSVKLDMGDYAGAKEHLVKNLQQSRAMGFRIFESQVHSWLALALLHLGESGEAARTCEEAIRIAGEMNQPSQLAAAKRTLGVIGLARLERMEASTGSADPWKESGAPLMESLELFEELKMQHEAGRSHLELARFYRQTHDVERCREHLLRSKQIFQKLGARGDLARADAVQVQSAK